MWWLALGLVAGCALLQPPVSPDLTRPDADRMEDARERLADARTPTARRLAMVDLVASIGLTPFAGGAAPSDARRYALGAPDSLVGGFIPGRHPIARGELVTVRTSLRDGAAVDLLEASRILVQRSQVENVPGRSLLIAFSSGDRVPRAPAQGVENALWASSKVRARARLESDLLRVTYPASDTARADSTITLPALPADPTARVTALVGHLLRLTTPATPDTTALRPDMPRSSSTRPGAR